MKRDGSAWHGGAWPGGRFPALASSANGTTSRF